MFRDSGGDMYETVKVCLEDGDSCNGCAFCGDEWKCMNSPPCTNLESGIYTIYVKIEQ